MPNKRIVITVEVDVFYSKNDVDNDTEALSELIEVVKAVGNHVNQLTETKVNACTITKIKALISPSQFDTLENE